MIDAPSELDSSQISELGINLKRIKSVSLLAL